MESTEPTSNASPQSLLPPRWADLGAKAVGWLFGDARTGGDPAPHQPEQEQEGARTVSATESESARKLRFWFSERNRHTL